MDKKTIIKSLKKAHPLLERFEITDLVLGGSASFVLRGLEENAKDIDIFYLEAKRKSIQSLAVHLLDKGIEVKNRDKKFDRNDEMAKHINFVLDGVKYDVFPFMGFSGLKHEFDEIQVDGLSVKITSLEIELRFAKYELNPKAPFVPPTEERKKKLKKRIKMLKNQLENI